MKKWIWTALTTGTIALMTVGVAACGDDSSSASPTDAGKDGTVIGEDGGPGTDSGPGTDGGAPCTFASYVIGLTKQPGTATPDPTLGSGCQDTAATTTQADFASLFP